MQGIEAGREELHGGATDRQEVEQAARSHRAVGVQDEARDVDRHARHGDHGRHAARAEYGPEERGEPPHARAAAAADEALRRVFARESTARGADDRADLLTEHPALLPWGTAPPRCGSPRRATRPDP